MTKNTAPIFTLVLAAAATLASPAFAAKAESKTTQVLYSDLNLATQDGQEELDRRLERAARDVCDLGGSTVGSRIASREGKKCYKAARKQLDSQFAKLVEDSSRG